MKKHIARIALIMGALLLFLGSCSNFFEAPPPSADPAPQEGQGILNLSINGADARTLAPDPDIFEKYDLSILPSTFDDDRIGVTRTITAPFNNVEVSLDPGLWDIEIIAYVGEVASVRGVNKKVSLRAGEVKPLKIMLDQVVASDVAGTFVYDIVIPSTVAQRLDSESKKRDPYGVPPLDLPFPESEFKTEGKTADEYFSGAILRIIPDVEPEGEDIAGIVNEGYVILDLLYGDESPGEAGYPGEPDDNNSIDPKRYSKGRIELPAGRYHLYLSLVSDRAIGTDINPDTEDYIGIFKEEVVYIYPSAETATPASYTAFADTDMDAQVYFEGHTHIFQPSGYTAKQVQVSRSNYPSHYYENAENELWTAPIDDKGNWHLYIPSWKLAQGDKEAAQGHLNYENDTVYFRFKMTSGSLTLYSPWQAYVTREKQGQIDLDLYATIETLTLAPNGGTMTVQSETGHEDSIAKISDTVYDIVRGVNFSIGPYSSYVNDVLITVTPPTGKAIASFDPKNYSDINWSYAADGWNEYYYGGVNPATAPTQDDKPVVYVLQNYQAHSLDHTTDNFQPGNYADLGNYAVNVSARYFDFQGSVTMNLDHMPSTVNAYFVAIYDADGNRLIDRKPLTRSGTTFRWDFDPQNYLPVYHYTGGGDDSYYDYDIYNCSEEPERYVNFYDSPYDSNGVRFQFVFVDTTQFPGFEEVAHTQLTRTYTAPELVKPIQLGISDTMGISDTIRQFTANEDLPGRDYGHNYDPDYDAQYYYFFSDPDTPYTVEYQDYYGYASVNDGLTDVGVYLYDSSSSDPVADVDAYPNQAVYGIPNGSSTGNVVELVTVEITRQSNWDHTNGYKLKIELPEPYTVTADTIEETLSIREGTVKYYRFTPPTDRPYYSLFQGHSAVNPDYANITVNAYRNGSAYATPLDGDGNNLYYATTLSSVILEIRENSVWTSSDFLEFTFRVTIPKPLPPGTSTSDLETFSIRGGTTQYYRATVTPETNYNLIFRDTADITSTGYADVSVRGIYSDTSYTSFFDNGDNVTPYTISPPPSSPEWVILQVTETTGANTIKPFGIKLFIPNP